MKICVARATSVVVRDFRPDVRHGQGKRVVFLSEGRRDGLVRLAERGGGVMPYARVRHTMLLPGDGWIIETQPEVELIIFNRDMTEAYVRYVCHPHRGAAIFRREK